MLVCVFVFVYVNNFRPPLELGFEPQPLGLQKLGARSTVLTTSTQLKFCEGVKCIGKGEGWGLRNSE